MSSFTTQLIKMVAKKPVLLVIIAPVYFLYFLVKQIIVSVPDTVNDFKKKDDGGGDVV